MSGKNRTSPEKIGPLVHPDMSGKYQTSPNLVIRLPGWFVYFRINNNDLETNCFLWTVPLKNKQYKVFTFQYCSKLVNRRKKHWHKINNKLTWLTALPLDSNWSTRHRCDLRLTITREIIQTLIHYMRTIYSPNVLWQLLSVLRHLGNWQERKGVLWCGILQQKQDTGYNFV